MQVYPIKHKLKPPRSKRLKVRCVVPVLIFAFKFNLRRYNEVYEEAQAASKKKIDQLVEREGREDHRLEAGAYTRSRFRST